MAYDAYGFCYPAVVMFDAVETGYGYAREPVMRRMPDGSLFCTALTGGATEPDNKNAVVAVRSFDDGEHWTGPEVVFEHSARGLWVPEIFTEGERPCMFVHTYNAPTRYWEITAFRSYTEDSGKTWSLPRSLPGGTANVSVRQGIVLSNGDWLFPVYWQVVEDCWDWVKTPTSNGFNLKWPSCCGVLVSTDQGEHFELHGDLRCPEHVLLENNCVELETGHLVMLIRAQDAGVLYRSDSFDFGRSWSPAKPSDIPNASSKIALNQVDGKVVLVHNPYSVPGEGPHRMQDRKRFSLWVSDDGMQSWKTQKLLADPEKAFFYPHLFADGEKETIYLACEDGKRFYLLKIPYADVL